MTKVGWQENFLNTAPDEFLVELLRVFNGILQHGASRMDESFVHDAFQKTRAELGDRFPLHCQHTVFQAFVGGVCLHDPRTGGGYIGMFSRRSAARFSVRPKDRRTSFDKSRAAGLPLWIISLDLSKAFDTVNWETLWKVLH